jgi:hypothetical protein
MFMCDCVSYNINYACGNWWLTMSVCVVSETLIIIIVYKENYIYIENSKNILTLFMLIERKNNTISKSTTCLIWLVASPLSDECDKTIFVVNSFYQGFVFFKHFLFNLNTPKWEQRKNVSLKQCSHVFHVSISWSLTTVTTMPKCMYYNVYRYILLFVYRWLQFFFSTNAFEFPATIKSYYLLYANRLNFRNTI